MRRNTDMSSRMTNYQNPVKNTSWKWTPAKIATFSVLGFVMAALVYFETNTGASSYTSQSLSTQESSNTTEPADLDTEYEKFLKQGQKIVSSETLDNLEEIQATTDSNVSSKTPVETKKSSAAKQAATKTIDPTPQKNGPSTPTKQAPSVVDNSSKSTGNVIANNLELNELTTSSNTRNSLGTLEETTAPIELPETQSSDPQSTNDPITEIFYTTETISGTINAASDAAPIEGVIITVNGTKNRAVSDSNGRYSIEVPGDPELRTIQYSFKGNTTERDVSPGRSVINVRF